jgi:hypothetical protein
MSPDCSVTISPTVHTRYGSQHADAGDLVRSLRFQDDRRDKNGQGEGPALRTADAHDPERSLGGTSSRHI